MFGTRIILTKLVNWMLNMFSLHRSGRLHRSGGLSGFRLKGSRLSGGFHLNGLSGSRLKGSRLSGGFHLSGLSGSRSDGSDESIYANLYNFHSPSIPTNDVLKG
jgi:hypothetical protein